jgi:aminoglycoside phosphotransferase (APT) family kinase protein
VFGVLPKRYPTVPLQPSPRPALDARIRSALDGELSSRLGLDSYRIHAGHFFHLEGEGRRGPVFVSFFPVAEEQRVARVVASHRLLADAGIDAPEVLDVDRDGEVDAALAWIAVRRHPGAAPRRDDPAVRARAMRILARIHAIPRPEGAPDIEALPFYPDFSAFRSELDRVVGFLRGAGVRVHPDELARVDALLGQRVEAMLAHRPAPPVALLHADYQPTNLLERPDGRLLVLDLEGASFGAFPFDLARTLYKFRFKPSDAILDRMPLPALFEDPVLCELQQHYLAEAGSAARDFWAAHGRSVLFYGYLKMVSRRAKAAANPKRYGRLMRWRSAAQAQRRWNRVVRYAETAGSG